MNSIAQTNLEQINRLLDRPDIWRGDEALDYDDSSIASGFSALDDELPGGGWPNGALTEVLMAQEGVGERRVHEQTRNDSHL